MSFNSFLFFLSIPFQVAAVVFALAMIRTSRHRRPWVLLALATAFMLIYRCLASLSGEFPAFDQSTPLMQQLAAISSVTISFLLFLALFSVRRLSMSEQKAVGALRVSEEQFRQLADALPLLAWVSRPDGYAEYFNQRWFDFTGTTLEQSRADGWLNLVHVEDRPRVVDRWRNCLLSGRPFDVEYRCRRAGDGAFVWYLARCLAVRDDDGTIVKWVGTCTDIDDQKRIGERFRENANTIETINFVGRALVSELDLSKLVQTVTDAATGMIGAQFGAFFYNVVDERGESHALYSVSGMPRQEFEQLGAPRNKDVLTGIFKGHGVIRLVDLSQDHRQNLPLGHLPARSYLAAPVISRTGEVIGGLFFGHRDAAVFKERDEQIIEGIAAQAAIAIDNARLYEAQQRARAEAEAASRMKDEFLATLSHELRTPLNAILGYSHLLRKGKIAPEELTESLEIIERNARAQTQIMEDLLDMSRIISGKIRLDIQRMQLQGVIRAAIESVQPGADAKGVRIDQSLDMMPATVSGDPNRLQQVFWNLLSNAIKFTPRGGHVEVSLGRVNSQLEAVISDTGEGIKPEFLPHVFERFRQADASTTRRHGGLGLGLSIVKQLVELHGGTVWAKSKGVGAGATFTVSLPIAAVQMEVESPERRASRTHAAQPNEFEGPALTGVRMLVVDDEPDARTLIRRVLEDRGAVVMTAESGQEALDMLQSADGAIAVLISDIGMPQMDGYELINRVRILPADKGGAIPAVALTAFARTEDRTRALMAGYQMHVAKPVDPNELVVTVATLAALKIGPPGIIGSASPTRPQDAPV